MGHFSRKPIVLKIQPYEHLADERLNCRNLRKTMIIQSDRK